MESTPSGREMADIAIQAGAIDMAQGVVHCGPPARFFEVFDMLRDERRFHTYGSPAGLLSYREALAALINQSEARVKTEQIMATAGVTGGLVSALLSHCDAGEKVLLPEPFFPAHEWAIKSLHLSARYLPYRSDWTLDMDLLAREISAVKAFILVNPANPSGTLISKDELLVIASMCREHGVLLIVDEVYRDFIWEGHHTSPIEWAEDLEQIVVLRSWSKNLALAGWRIGYAVSSPTRIHDMTHNHHEAFYVGAPAPPQYVLTELLNNHWDDVRGFIDEIVKLYGRNRDIVTSAFTDYGMEPQPKEGAYYMIIKHNRANDMSAMKELLDRGIAVAPGSPFFRSGHGDTGFIRVHFALSESDQDKVVGLLER